MNYKAPKHIPKGYEWIITYNPEGTGPIFVGKMRKIKGQS